MTAAVVPSTPEELLDAVDAPPWGLQMVEGMDLIDPEEDAEEFHARFHIEDTGQADWAMRKLGRVAGQQKAVNELAARQAEPIERWRRDEQAKLDRERLFWEALLIEYHRGVAIDDPKARSIRLPHGVLKSRQQQATWHFDDATFIEWALTNHPDLVRIKREVEKSLAKEMLKTDGGGAVTTFEGEIVPGVSVTAGDRKFTVEPEVVR